MKVEGKEQIAKHLYEINKDLFTNWTESQFNNWCKNKIKSESVQLVKIHDQSPFVYWNLKIVNVTAKELDPTTITEIVKERAEEVKKTRGRPKLNG
jgi:hypothetical protein